MTFSVQRKRHNLSDFLADPIPAGVVGSGFTIGVNYGPIMINVDETSASHLRMFHTDLGRLLDEFEAELHNQEVTGVRPR